MPIHMIIVEAHHHVLEHIHYLLRQRERRRNRNQTNRLRSWSLLHFDSHPDLACPNIPAKACFLPRSEFPYKRIPSDLVSLANIGADIEYKNLYEKLDTSIAGIAEWILPLVLGADLNTIYWIKNNWCDQFESTEYQFSVGAWNDKKLNHEFTTVDTFLDLKDEATMKVSLMHPYYLNDDSSVEESELILKKPLHLFVVDSPDDIVLDDGQDWILDICLDYFLCRNPFLDELALKFGEHFTGLLLRSVTSTKFSKNNSIYNDCVAASIYRQHHQTFYSLSKKIIESCIIRTAETHQKMDSIDSILSISDKDTFLSEYLSPTDAEDLWNDILAEITRFIIEDKSLSPTEISSIILNSFPNLSLPHDDTYTTEGIGDETISMKYLGKIKSFGRHLRSFLPKSEPLCITIARSSDDGFTPSYMVDQLQDSVVEEVHSIFCCCNLHSRSENGSCNLVFLTDYGESEGSTLEDKRA